MYRHLSMLLIFFLMFLFSGCGGSYYVNAKMVENNGNKNKMEITRVIAHDVDQDSIPYKGYKNSSNVNFQCSHIVMLNAIATKAIENGYSYFTIEMKNASNPTPMAINHTKAHLRYCNDPYYDNTSDMLDDKCWHNGFGSGYQNFMRDVDAHFYKTKNPLFPTWNASETQKETLEIMKKECYPNRQEEVSFMLNEYTKIK